MPGAALLPAIDAPWPFSFRYFWHALNWRLLLGICIWLRSLHNRVQRPFVLLSLTHFLGTLALEHLQGYADAEVRILRSLTAPRGCLRENLTERKPSRTLVTSVRVAASARDATRYGIV